MTAPSGEGQPQLFGEEPHGSGPPASEPVPEPTLHSQAPSDPSSPNDPPVDVAKLQQDLATAQENERRANEQLEKANSLLYQAISTPPMPIAPSVTPDPEPLGPPPNPIEDPEGFGVWHQKSIEQAENRVRTEIVQVRADQDEAATRTRLWNEFQTEYPEYAGHEDIATIAFLQETRGTGQLPTDHSGLKKAVKARLDRIFEGYTREKPSSEAAAGDDPPPTPPKPQEPNRTMDVGEPSRPATPPPEPESEKIPSMIESIHRIQDGSGFF